MKHIITQAYNQGDWFTKDFALIRVTEAFKAEIKEIKSVIEQAPEKYRSYIDVTVYNIPFADFYDSNIIEDLEDSQLCPDIQQILSLESFTDDYIDILNTVNLCCIEGEVEAYSAHCLVSESGVQFKANNKYGDGEEIGPT